MSFKVFDYQLSIDNFIAHGASSEAAYPRDLLEPSPSFSHWSHHERVVYKLQRLNEVAFQLCLGLKKEKETTLSQRLNYEANASIANSYNTLINNAEKKLQEERIKKVSAEALYQKLKIENTERVNLCNEVSSLRQSFATAEESFRTLGVKNEQEKLALRVLENSRQTLNDELADIELRHQTAKAELMAYEERLNAKFERLRLALENGGFSSAGTSDSEF